MNKSYSLYLDVLRFTAALVVFFSHVASKDLSGGILWQFKAYSQTAVMVFFVMSGYVIAYVTQIKEKSITDYSIARVSRLYSVVIPALIITVIFDAIGLYFNPDLYYEGPWTFADKDAWLNYLLSLFLIQNVWEINLNPGINTPFWSLTYEWFYYIFWGVFLFIKGPVRYIAIGILAAMAGPTIVALFPIWLIGVAVFHAQQSSALKRVLQNSYVFYLSLVMLAILIYLSPIIRGIDFSIKGIGRDSILGDYFDAIVFACHMLLITNPPAFVRKVLNNNERIIRWTASLTFALYLFHRPLIQTIAAVYDGSHEDWSYRLAMILLPLIFIGLIGSAVESQKYIYKKYLNKLIKSS